jgi:dTMP kinase
LLHSPMDALTETMLMFAGRRDHLQRVILPALGRGATVLCDRFTDATFAYQGAGRGFDAEVLSQLERWVQEGTEPDLTLWFDLDPELAAARRAEAREADRFERQDAAFFTRVREGYRARMATSQMRIVRIDASAGRDAVARQIAAVLTERGW